MIPKKDLSTTYLTLIPLEIFLTFKVRNKKHNNINIKYKLIEAYPGMLSLQKVDWGDNNTYLVLDVNFNFKNYILE